MSPINKNINTIYLAGGCFWETEKLFVLVLPSVEKLCRTLFPVGGSVTIKWTEKPGSCYNKTKKIGKKIHRRIQATNGTITCKQ